VDIDDLGRAGPPVQAVHVLRQHQHLVLGLHRLGRLGEGRLTGDAAGFPFAAARNYYAAAAGISEEGLQSSINGQLSISLAQGACP
jgi:hypothetical protein